MLDGSAQYSFQNISDPSGYGGTQAFGISGSTIVGAYAPYAAPVEGFAYSDSAYSEIAYPGGYGGEAIGIYGSDIVGYYNTMNFQGSPEAGFLYNGTTYTSISASGYTTLTPTGIYQSEIVGNYRATGSATSQGFIDQNGSFASLVDPQGATTTTVTGIWGNDIVGYYLDSSELDEGFIYNQTSKTFTTLDYPGTYENSSALFPQGTRILGISSNLVVGSFVNDTPGVTTPYQGFVYNLTTDAFTVVDVNGAEATQIFGTNGTDLVGAYMNDDGKLIGFEAVPMPEPSSYALVGLGLFFGLLAWRGRIRRG
jgi:hypothetical protein